MIEAPPAPAVQATTVGEHTAHAGEPEPRHQALVVEDDALVRESLRLYLSHYGYDVFTAASSHEALDKVPGIGRLDVLLVDYRLDPLHEPDVNTGIHLVHELRAACHMSLPAVILTAEASDDAREQAQASGFEFIRKPISPEALLRALGRATQKG